jgi:UDP-N-acetylglucosamine acyltransferase
MVQVHRSAVVHKDSQLSDSVTIGPNCVIDSGVSIGAGTVLDANVVISKNVKIGQNNHFFPNCAIGGWPQVLGLSADEEIGGLVIGNNNIVREQVTINPSIYRGEFTKIGSDNLFMIGVHIGHDCILEERIVMCNYVQLSGHCKIGTGVWLYAAGLAGVNHDIAPFLIVSGHYPPRVRGVNKRGMERAGLSEQQQQKIIEAYKKLYRQGGGSLLENAKALAGEDGLDENVRAMVDVIIKSGEQRFGRYLEKFRD